MGGRKGRGREARMAVAVTPRELQLLRDETFAVPEYADRFRESGGKYVARFTASELDDMLGHVAASASHARRAMLRRELDALYDRLEVIETAAPPSRDAL